MSVDSKAPTVKSDRYYERAGYFFQAMFILAMTHRISLGPRTDFLPVYVLDKIGWALFMFCLFRIYVLKLWSNASVHKSESLITTGVFKYTRHPMYTGVAMAMVRSWWPVEGGYTFGHVLTFVLTVVGVIGAAYLQEKETLARFGVEAEAYYARTPRLFFLYPFVRRSRTDKLPSAGA